MWSDDHQIKVQQLVDNRAQHFMVCWFSTVFFLNYYFFEFPNFVFHDTYNTWLKDRYKDDPWTHLDLWLEGGSSGGLDRKQMYGLSNTTTEDLLTTCDVLTIGCLQSISSTQTLEFEMILDQLD